MVLLIEFLCEEKKYKTETLYLAVSLADRFISKTLCQNLNMPDLVTLAATSLLMAAKIEEPIEPSFNRIIKLLKQANAVDLKR